MSFAHWRNDSFVLDMEIYSRANGFNAGAFGALFMMLSAAGKLQGILPGGTLPSSLVRHWPGVGLRALRPLLTSGKVVEDITSGTMRIRDWDLYTGPDSVELLKRSIRIDDETFFNPDIYLTPIAIGALGLFFQGICWTSFHHTDGVIPMTAIRTMFGGKCKRYRQSLHTCNWWTISEDGQTVTIKNFTKYNVSENEKAAKAAARKAAKAAKLAAESANGHRNGAESGVIFDQKESEITENQSRNSAVDSVDSHVGDARPTHAESQIPNSDEESRNNNNSNNIVGAVDSDSVAVVVSLASLGVSERVAQALTASHPLDSIRQQIDWLPSRHPDRPAAMIVDAIKGGWDAPVGVVRQADAAQVKAQAQKRGESLKEKTERDEQAVRAEYKARFDALPAGEQSEIMRQAEESVGESRPEFAGSPAKKLLRKQAVTAARNRLLDERAAAMPHPPSGSAPPIVARAP